ncbi:DNA-binding transcriptional LysR family regulator [Actinoplanes octamycinicus]|uniref:DNA-binding transcriptional LysR family regulator n=1 Tax=Actinoplanes octamycinicus TaxID=135948 RepID=A0A7W7H571_9ACTN|nr:LysR family transcriptional regulator [Actinoplanes octamycinicus]MBB4744216.1 DNA-binding transcriptional LysR family regulator [Actinoplanes octamycinicus]GIE56825.1 LysR family transcriptional regulator [Actinoplanes octamycinicus]
MTELRQLRYFVAVADQLSFTRAAAQLHVAQQSLSQQIGVLERQIGVRLFDRDTRGTRLTPAGEALLPGARDVLTRTEEAVAAAQRAATDQISLGFLSSTANYMLPAVVRAVRDRLPRVALSTHDLPIDALVAGLREGRIDLAFTRPPLVADLATWTITTEPVCAVLPSGHRLAGAAALSLGELAGEDWVLTPRESWPPWHDKYDRDFTAAGFEPRVVQRASGVPSLLGLVAAGVGVTRLARSAASIRRSGVVFVPLTGEVAETVLAWNPARDHPMRGQLQAIVGHLASTTDLTSGG